MRKISKFENCEIGLPSNIGMIYRCVARICRPIAGRDSVTLCDLMYGMATCVKTQNELCAAFWLAIRSCTVAQWGRPPPRPS